MFLRPTHNRVDWLFMTKYLSGNESTYNELRLGSKLNNKQNSIDILSFVAPCRELELSFNGVERASMTSLVMVLLCLV